MNSQTGLVTMFISFQFKDNRLKMFIQQISLSVKQRLQPTEANLDNDSTKTVVGGLLRARENIKDMTTGG